jgi:RNA polymerase sigma factor (sigma-70 family)
MRSLNQEDFDVLLMWLGANREDGGKRYEEIRQRLIKFYTYRGCPEADELADETINRVAPRVHELAKTYTGDPALYFYGVAHNIHLEYLRMCRTRPQPPPPKMQADDSDILDAEYECLDQCVQQLSPESREIILQYYQEEKRSKIDRRRALADRLGIAINALRIRAYRIRASLQACMQHCLKEKGSA